MKTIGVKINLPINIYYGVKRLINLTNSQMSDFCSALCINRMIDKGFLDEFGNPIEMPHLDFSSIDIKSGISMNDLREKTVPRSTFSLTHDFKQK